MNDDERLRQLIARRDRLVDLIEKRERIIVARGPSAIPLFNRIELDPPWFEQGGGKSKRGIRYPGVKTKDMPSVIAALPLWRPDPEGCHVWMWCVSHRVAKGEAAWVFAQLGVRMVRKFVWKKDRMGIGQYARGKHEDLCLGLIGKLPPLPSAASVDDVIDAPVPRNDKNARIHSRKPRAAIMRMNAITPPGNTAELFARGRRHDAWVCGRIDGAGVGDDREIPITYAPPHPLYMPRSAHA